MTKGMQLCALNLFVQQCGGCQATLTTWGHSSQLGLLGCADEILLLLLLVALLLLVMLHCCMASQDEANELETELLQELYRHLLLEAGQVYKQRQEDGWHDEDTTAEDQKAWDAAAAAAAEADSDEDSDIEEEDEGEAAHQAALRRSKQRRSWKPSKGEVLIILVGMMLLGELFVMLDMLGLFKRR